MQESFSFGTERSLWAGRPRNRDSVLGKSKPLFSSLRSTDCLWLPIHPPLLFVPWTVSLRVQREVKQDGSIITQSHFSS
jgi:hypothetical protein